MAWLRHLYDGWRGRVADHAPRRLRSTTSGPPGSSTCPASTTIWCCSSNSAPTRSGRPSAPERPDRDLLGDHRRFGYDDCPGHPTWLEPAEWLGAPLAGRYPPPSRREQPTARLHSQLDVGAFSQSTKVRGREPIRINPIDRRGARHRRATWSACFNDRGSCLAGAAVTDTVRPARVQLSTVAWYDPLDPADPDADVCPRQPERPHVPIAAPLSSPRGARDSTRSWTVERWTARCRRSAPTIRPPMERRDH